jgi:cysteine desulfurase
MSKLPLYFDNNATTALDPRVLEAMLPYFKEHFGNPESTQHVYGWKAEAAISRAREQVAAILHAASPTEIIFTAGATESMNIAILGYLAGLGPGRFHLLSSVAEHKATLTIFERAQELGHDITLLPVNRHGQVEARAVFEALRDNTVLVSLLHANNEIGSLNPIAEIGANLRSRGDIVFHVDAAQTVGKVPIDLESMGINLLSLSAHKFFGPKGTGALYAKKGTHLRPILFGGGQERALRSGTHNVAGIVGLGEACAIAVSEMPEETQRLTHLRDKIITGLVTAKGGANERLIELNGHPTERVCNNVHLSVHGLALDQILTNLSDIAFSTASACAAGGPSHVLKAIGRTSADPLTTSLRFGLGRFTTEAEVDTLITRVRATVHKS